MNAIPGCHLSPTLEELPCQALELKGVQFSLGLDVLLQVSVYILKNEIKAA